jgi:D-amino-acid dehydrogenase
MRVVIIGAGAIGLASAYFLAEQGAEVIVLEARGPGGGASRVNAGWVVPAMSGPVPGPGLMLKSARWMLQRQSPLKVRASLDPAFIAFMIQLLRHSNKRDYQRGLWSTIALNKRTFELFDLLAESGVSFEEHREGVTALFLAEDELDGHLHESRLLEQLGADTPEVLTGAEVRRSSPAISKRVVGAIRSPDQRFLDPDSFIDGLTHACQRLGVTIHGGQQVTRIDHHADRILSVETNRRWGADAFVLATGAWTSQLGRQLGLRIPIQPGKGYGFDLPQTDSVRGALYLSEAKVAVTPLNTRLRCAGTMEFTNLDETIDLKRAEGIPRSAHDYLDGLAHAGLRPWTGLRPMTPDGLPLIGPVPGYSNLVIAAGHCMLGITLAPVTGEIVSQLLLAETMPAVALPFRPHRFRNLR